MQLCVYTHLFADEGQQARQVSLTVVLCQFEGARLDRGRRPAVRQRLRACVRVCVRVRAAGVSDQSVLLNHSASTVQHSCAR